MEAEASPTPVVTEANHSPLSASGLALEALYPRRVITLPDFGRLAAVSASLVGPTAATTLIALAYWMVAARQSSVDAVGVGGAAISLMMLLGNAGLLGLGTLMIAKVPTRHPGRRRRLVRTSMLIVGGTSVLLGLLAAAAVRVLPVSDLDQIGRPLNAVGFAVGTGLMGLAMAFDQAALAAGSAGTQLERNLLAGITRLAALVGLSAAGRHSVMDLVLAWTLGNLVSLLLVAYRTRTRRTLEEQRRLADLDSLRRLARSAAGHHALNLMLQAPLQLLSLVVVVGLSAESNGFFSAARSLAGFAFVLPFAIAIGLLASAGGDERQVVRRIRLTVPLCLVVSAVALVVLLPLGHLALSAFGRDYSASGLAPLRLLVLAGLPLVIKDHFVALRRVQGRVGQAALVCSAGTVLEVAAAVIGADVGGLVGLCGFWVAALAVEASLMSVALRRTVVALRTADDAAGVSVVGLQTDQWALPSRTETARIDTALARPADELGGGAMRFAAGQHARMLRSLARRPTTGAVVAAMSLGLVLIAWAVQRSRALEPQAPTQWIYWTGYLLAFLPAAAAVLSAHTRPRDRLLLSLALPVLFQLSREVVYPTRFMFHDELIQANSLRLIDVTHHVFATNSLLPVAQYYPGLAAATDGVQQLAHLSGHASALVVLLLARLILSGAIVAVLQRVSGSVRVACLAALIYTCNPQAVFFDSQFSYQSLALPLALLTVFFFAFRHGTDNPWRALSLPLLALAGTTVTHHLTAVVLVAVFGLWWLLESVVQRGLPSSERRGLAVMTLAGVAMVAGWAALPDNQLLLSVGHILSGTVQRPRGVADPLWQRVLSGSAIVVVLGLLLAAGWQARAWLRRREAPVTLLILIGAAYPIVLVGRLMVGTVDRSAGFVFLGIGFVVALWYVEGPHQRGRLTALVALPLLAIVFVGGIVSGAGTASAQLPGRFLVSADSRSIDAQSLQAAQWLRERLPAGSRVYADRVDGLLATAVGGQHAVTRRSDGVDASRILLAPTWTDADRALIAAAHISYVVVDERDADSLPAEPDYVEAGEYGEKNRTAPVPAAALRKLMAVPGVQRIFDNGALVVYDVRALDGR